MSDTGNELESAAGGRLPRTGAKRAVGAQVVAVAAGILAVTAAVAAFLPAFRASRIENERQLEQQLQSIPDPARAGTAKKNTSVVA